MSFNNLFKSKADSFSRSELVIMITPKILKNSTDLDDFTTSVQGLFSIPVGENLESIPQNEDLLKESK